VVKTVPSLELYPKRGTILNGGGTSVNRLKGGDRPKSAERRPKDEAKGVDVAWWVQGGNGGIKNERAGGKNESRSDSNRGYLGQSRGGGSFFRNYQRGKRQGPGLDFDLMAYWRRSSNIYAKIGNEK